MIGQQHDNLLVGFVPELDPPQPLRILLPGVVPQQLDGVVPQDLPVLRDRPFLHDPVMGILFLAGHKEHPGLIPRPEELEIDIAPVHHHDRAGREVQRTGNRDLVDPTGRDAGKHGQVALVVQQQMKLHGPLGLPVLGPVKQACTELDERGIEAEEPVLEPERPFAERHLLAAAQDLIKQLLVELPGPVLVGVGQGRAFRGRLDAQMPGLAETTGQAPANLPKGVGLPELAEQHGHELVPAVKALGASIGSGGLHGFKELATRK